MEFLSYDPWANVISRNGYTADELREGLHKTIRRNKVDLAVRIAMKCISPACNWRKCCGGDSPLFR